MKPSEQQVLQVLIDRIRDDAIPALAGDYAGQQLQRGLQLLQSVSEGLNNCVAWRVAEIQALRKLLGNALPFVSDTPALAASLTLAVDTPEAFAPESLTLTALDGRIDSLRRLLIELHVWSESSNVPQASRVNQSIWSELLQSTVRRKLSVARF